MYLQLEGDLKDMQRKVECSKAEIMRISRDLRPIEVYIYIHVYVPACNEHVYTLR